VINNYETLILCGGKGGKHQYLLGFRSAYSNVSM